MFNSCRLAFLAVIVVLLLDRARVIARSSSSSRKNDELHKDDMLALRQVVEDIKYLPVSKKVCIPEAFGTSYGTHKLCPLFPHTEHFQCHFLSFGISTDYTFDEMLQKRYNCSGLAFDPTVDFPEQLLPGVRFVKAGANSPNPPSKGTFMSVPKIRKQYGHPIYALKMDCEGCEYSLASDILADDPNFFQGILQFNFEIHLPRSFARTDKDVYNLGRLFRLIYDSGMRLVDVDDGACGPQDQKLGCHPLLASVNFPCEPGCRSYLFAHKHPDLKAWREAYEKAYPK